jgi:hypothetical protein
MISDPDTGEGGSDPRTMGSFGSSSSDIREMICFLFIFFVIRSDELVTESLGEN